MRPLDLNRRKITVEWLSKITYQEPQNTMRISISISLKTF